MPKVRWIMSYGFCGKFYMLSSIQKFWKSVKIWQSYKEFYGGNFFETQCIIALNWPPIWNRWSSSRGLSAIAELLVFIVRIYMYTVSQKVCRPNHGYNFVNSWLICKILSFLKRAINFQQNPYLFIYHALSMLLYYLMKLKNNLHGHMPGDIIDTAVDEWKSVSRHVAVQMMDIFNT